MELGQQLNILLDILSHTWNFMYHVVHQALHVPKSVAAVNSPVHLVAQVLSTFSEFVNEFAEDQIVVHVVCDSAVESVGLVGFEPTTREL